MRKPVFKKKGTAWQYYFLIFAFYIGVVAYFITTINFTFDGFIGENAYKLLEAKQKGDEALFFLQLSSKLATQQAIYELADKGGMDFSACGDYYGYTLWQSENQEKASQCIPSRKTGRVTFQLFFEDILSQQLLTHPNFLFPVHYNTTLIGKLNVEGKVDDDIVIPVGSGQDTKIGDVVGEGIFSWPLRDNNPTHFIITSCFGQRICKECLSKYHKAIDIAGAKGDDILATAEGTVIQAGGNFNNILINHPSLGYSTQYLHNDAVTVQVGQNILRGQVIGKVGTWGPNGRNHYKSPHLHFSILKHPSNTPLDPLLFYNRTSLGLKYQKASSCYYNRNVNRYSYKDEIERNAI